MSEYRLDESEWITLKHDISSAFDDHDIIYKLNTHLAINCSDKRIIQKLICRTVYNIDNTI